MSEHESQPQAAQRMYGRRAGKYNDSWHPSFAKYVVQYLAPQPGSHILDLACGTGLVSLEAARAVGPNGSVTGVDITDGMLSVAYDSLESLQKEKAPIGNVQFFKHDITDLDSLESIKGKAFDAITCASALVLLDSPLEAVRLWTKYLKIGGKFVTDVTHPKSLVPGIALERAAIRLGIQPPSQRVWAQSGDDLKNLMEAVGMIVEDVHLQEQQGFGMHYHEAEDGEAMWAQYSATEYGTLLREESIRDAAKAIFIEEWKCMADKYGAVKEVDGAFIARCQKTEGNLSKTLTMTGSCACGSVTWSAAVPPIAIAHCFCSQCRKVSGSPFLSMMEFPIWAVNFNPRLSELSSISLTPNARRSFCRSCGTTLTYRQFALMEHIEIATGTLDEESLSGITMEQILGSARKNWCWLKEKVSWWNIPDDGWQRWEKGSIQNIVEENEEKEHFDPL